MPDETIYSPGVLDIEITRGEKFYLQLICKDGLGAIINLTGYTAVVEMRPETESPNVYDLEPTIATPANGIILIDLDSDATFTKFAVGRYTWAALLKVTATGKRDPSFLIGTCLVLDRPNRT